MGRRNKAFLCFHHECVLSVCFMERECESARVRRDGFFNYSPIRMTPAPITHWYWAIGWDVFILASSIFIYFFFFKNWHHIFEPEHVDFKARVFSPHTVFIWTPHFISNTRDGWTLAAYKFSVTHYGLVSITLDFFWNSKTCHLDQINLQAATNLKTQCFGCL